MKISKELIGAVLFHHSADGITGGRIIATEAYNGRTDRACHACHKRTKRTEVMYQSAVELIIYLCYGIHRLFKLIIPIVTLYYMNGIKKQFFVSLLFLSSISWSQRFEGESELVYSLNTPYGEDFVALHPNGNEMAITRLNHPYNQGGKLDAGDIWKSKLDSGEWTSTNWHALNTEHFSSPIGYTNDGSAFIFNRVETKGGSLLSELWVHSKGQSQKLDVRYFKNKSSHQSGCLSADHRFMIISMESGATQGVEDLYVLTRDGKSWSAPKNLGTQINTEFQEITPFLTADNKTLYFATNGRKGEGSFDIYVSRRLDESWNNWSIPENLGSHVNSQGRETSFSFLSNAEFAYFISTQNSDGYGDVRRVKFQLDSMINVEKVDTTELITLTETSDKAGIKFLNAKNSQPIESVVTITVGESQTEFEPEPDGSVAFTRDLKGEAVVSGFLPIKIQSFSDSLVIVRMEPLELGRTILLEHVLFGRASTNVLQSSFEELDIVVKMMKLNPDVKILLKGHTDGNGDPAQNKKLSEARVNEVKRYLTGKGIGKKRIDGVGVGGLEPIASNSTEATRKLNRRVEFVISEN